MSVLWHECRLHCAIVPWFRRYEGQEPLIQREGNQGLVERLTAERNQLRGHGHTLYSKTKKPVQAHEIRQRRALALARAAALSVQSVDDGAPMEPIMEEPLSSCAAQELLQRLLTANLFEAATDFALTLSLEPKGLEFLKQVVASVAADCATKALSSIDASLNVWRPLRVLLERHDCEAINFELSAVAARAALDASPERTLPAWLLDWFGAAPPEASAPRQLRISGAHCYNAETGSAERRSIESLIQAVIEKYPAANARLRVRGIVGGGGDATVELPGATTSESYEDAKRLEDELRLIDPGCWPVRRNPAALCNALIESVHPNALREALRQVAHQACSFSVWVTCSQRVARHSKALVWSQVEKGCNAALEEKQRWGGAERQKRARWLTCGLIDKLHAAVARHQVHPPSPD